MERIDLDENFRVYGWSLADIRKVQRWFMAQNMPLSLDGLENHSLYHNYWPKQRIMRFLEEDFR